jgi:hypothetical protein
MICNDGGKNDSGGEEMYTEMGRSRVDDTNTKVVVSRTGSKEGSVVLGTITFVGEGSGGFECLGKSGVSRTVSRRLVEKI